MREEKSKARGILSRTVEMIFIVALYLVFLPLILVGFVLAVYKEVFVSKKLGVSFTMGQVLQIRWILHIFGTRPDENSYRLIRTIPTESYFGLFMFVAPLVVMYKVFGYRPALARYPEEGQAGFWTFVNERTRFFDESLHNLPAGIKQAVFPGAGLDVRPIDAAQKGLHTFELDQPRSQQFKIEMLKKAQIFDEQVRYVPVNFKEESWAGLLLQSEYKKTWKSWFLWEGVSNYLDEETVRHTLREISRVAAKGSIVACDLYANKFVRKTGRQFKVFLKPTGELFHFGLDMEGGLDNGLQERVETFLKECGLKLQKMEVIGRFDDPFGVLIEAVGLGGRFYISKIFVTEEGFVHQSS